MAGSIEEMRRNYGVGALRESDVDAHPLKQFRAWFDAAVAANKGEWFEANAMTLATATSDGVPSARIVLLKDAGDRGFTFYGNYGSQKGRELAENPVAALVFYWPWQERQVRVVGRVERVGRQEAEAYFHKRPRGSQLGAIASQQSQPVRDRAALEQQFAELDKQFEGVGEVPMPEQWGGWRLTPERFEFWQGQASRLHDRIVYTREAGGWNIGRLAP